MPAVTGAATATTAAAGRRAEGTACRTVAPNSAGAAGTAATGAAGAAVTAGA